MVAGAIATALVSLACLTPVLDAWWFRDDFWLMALARFTVNPFQFWIADHSSSFWFRPLGMSLWWLTLQWFGSDPTLQYAANIVLHGAVAVTFGCWMARLNRSARIGAAAMLFYAAHPVAVRTSLWLSDRFDLLATTFVFLTCALMLGDGWSLRRRIAIGICSLLACMSKESGLLVLPLALAHWIATPRSNMQQRARLRAHVVVVASVVILALAWRFAVMAPRTTQLLDLALPGALFSGMWAFLKWSPVAAAGALGWHGTAATVASLLMLFAFLYSGIRAFYPVSRSAPFARQNFLVAMVLLMSSALLVAPIAAQNLFGDSLLRDPITARLFHVAIASGFLILIAPSTTIFFAAKTRATWLLAAAALAISMAVYAGRDSAAGWVVATNGSLRSELVKLTATNGLTNLPDRCRLVITGPLAQLDEFKRNGDVMLKASIGTASAGLLRCLVVTDVPPTFALVTSDLCDVGEWARIGATRPGVPPHKFGNLCYQFLTPPLTQVPHTDPLTRIISSR